MLPIGSVLFLKKGTQKIMILNRGAVIKENRENVLYDYSGCVYPVGLNPEEVLYFNQENVDEVLYHGFSDDDEARFVSLYEEWIRTDGAKLKKGVVI